MRLLLAGHACLPYLRPGPAVWLFEQPGSVAVHTFWGFVSEAL